MRFIAIVIACGLCLAGCADYQARQQAEAAAQARQIAANDDARCQGYGAKPGSDAYVSCRMNIDNQRAAADNVNRAIVGQYLLTHR